MKIAEIFYSLQGEGSMVGVPSVFIRTSGCNLRCSWCDTPYTSWAPEGDEMSVAEIVFAAEAFGSTHIVITGGEPMIAPAIEELTRELRRLGKHITIETAGTVTRELECDLLSLSPKLSNSTPEGLFRAQHQRLRFQPEILRALIRRYEYQIKFVITQPDDLEEACQIVAGIEADRSKVILMPEGTDPGTLRQRGAWLAELCKETGFRFSPRLHVDLWGNRRGI